jgi:D-alanyl-D-alanine carboxypeptidase/D-alanyl-D-alanine-endopeptidase (penicillin-binding protein 4)
MATSVLNRYACGVLDQPAVTPGMHPATPISVRPSAGRRALLAGAALQAGIGRWATAGPLPSLRTPAPTATPPPVAALIESSGLPKASIGLHVQALPPGARARRAGAETPLIALNASAPFAMASTAKLVTAMAALDLLGPTHCWHTRAWLDGPLHEGRLLGDLVIVGGSDATLTTGALRTWFAQMQSRGLREVWGDIVLDRLALDIADEGEHALVPPPDLPIHARPDAFVLDGGVIKVGLQATAQRPLVRVQPRLDGLAVINHVAPGRGCSALARIERRLADAQLVVRGEWGPACGEREIAQLTLPHPEFTQRAVAELWREGGRRLKGRVRVRARAGAVAPSRPVAALPEIGAWASHRSPSLAELVKSMNKASDNLLARTLFLSLAGAPDGQPATLPAAKARLTRWLRAQGLAETDIAMDHGAGLSPEETASPQAMGQLLRRAWTGPHAAHLLASLPVAGVDGTLAHRMTTGPAKGRALLKTGSTRHARTLAGYVQGRSGQVHTLVAMVNDPQAAAAVPMLDEVVQWVASHA